MRLEQFVAQDDAWIFETAAGFTGLQPKERIRMCNTDRNASDYNPGRGIAIVSSTGMPRKCPCFEPFYSQLDNAKSQFYFHNAYKIYSCLIAMAVT